MLHEYKKNQIEINKILDINFLDHNKELNNIDILFRKIENDN